MRSVLLCIFALGMALTLGEAADAAELKKVRLYLDWFLNVEFAGVYAAMEKGCYKNAGIEVTGGPPYAGFGNRLMLNRVNFLVQKISLRPPFALYSH